MIITEYFTKLVHTSFCLYFGQEVEYTTTREIPLPEEDELSALIGKELCWEENVVLLLALMPHIRPQVLDLFFIQNKELDRPYTEFGGWKGVLHNGFLPTGQTAAFLLTADNPESRILVFQILSKKHWFYTEKILYLDHAKNEPFLSGKLLVTEDFLDKVLYNPVLKS